MKILPFLKELDFFDNLTEQDMYKLLEFIRVLKPDTGETIFDQGDPGTALYFIVRGKVAVRKRIPEGTEITLVELGPGEVLGEMALIEEEPRSAKAEAQVPSLLFYLDSRDFDTLVNMHPSIGLKMMKKLIKLICSRLRITSDTLVNFTSGGQR